MKLALRLFVVALLVPQGLLASEPKQATGESLFDKLTLSTDGAQRSVPYPFPRLLEQIKKRAGFDTDADPLAEILIPRGRSLQREAASPDYYRFPRVVIALDRESDTDLPVKNRLFLGYQERANTIEIISYSETAGRFEFQVVEDYSADSVPRVYPASRELCTSCHQNGATIFARPLWRESNFNRDVSAKIAAHHDTYLGIGVSPEHADADRVDFATDQAGLLQAYQNVWQLGCPDDSCRADLFLASVLRAIESESRDIYRWTQRERELLEVLRPSWQKQWPDGLPVASADIPDIAAADNLDNLPAELSPLEPRPPLAHWSAQTAVLRALEGLADQFLPDQALNHLQQEISAGEIDEIRIENALRNLRQDPDQSSLFKATPIDGVSLIQGLINEIEMSQ